MAWITGKMQQFGKTLNKNKEIGTPFYYKNENGDYICKENGKILKVGKVSSEEILRKVKECQSK